MQSKDVLFMTPALDLSGTFDLLAYKSPAAAAAAQKQDEDDSWVRQNFFRLRHADGTGRTFYVVTRGGVVVREYTVRWHGRKPIVEDLSGSSKWIGVRMTWRELSRNGYQYRSCVYHNEITGAELSDVSYYSAVQRGEIRPSKAR